jgi:hypothetical protein
MAVTVHSPEGAARTERRRPAVKVRADRRPMAGAANFITGAGKASLRGKARSLPMERPVETVRTMRSV